MRHENLSRREVIAIFCALMISMFVGSLDQTIVSTALPTIVGELGAVDLMLWVTTSYFLASTITMPIYGKLGDVFGRKYLFCLSQVLFVLGSLLCALSDSMGSLILGRAVQGLGGGGSMILSQAIVADIFPPKERGKYMGIMGISFGASMALGPLLGGFFTEQLSWRWCFWMNLPLGLIALAIAGVCLPHRKRRNAQGDGTKPSIDVLGIITMAAACTCLILALSLGGTVLDWNSEQVVGLLVGGVVVAVLFILIEARAKDPIIPLWLFKNRNFTLCTVAGLILMLGMSGAIAYLPTYFQIVDGLNAAAAGYMTLPLMLGMMIMSTVSGFLASKITTIKWMPVIACAVAAVAFGLLSTITIDTSLWQMGLILALLGLGVGTGQQILVLIVQNEFSVSVVGTTTAANNFFREIGGTIGSSLVGALFTANLGTKLAEYAGDLAQSIDLNALTPGMVRAMDSASQSAIQLAYNDALAPVFGWLCPLLAVACIMLFFLRKKPLSSTND